MHRRSLATGILLAFLALPALAQRAPLNTNLGNAPGVVNLNEAPKESLLLLYRTSKKMADQIIAERTSAPFTGIEDLKSRCKGCSPIWFSVNTLHLAFAGETTLKHRIRRPVTNALPSFSSAPGLPNRR
jgi:hypothetical protein